MLDLNGTKDYSELRVNHYDRVSNLRKNLSYFSKLQILSNSIHAKNIKTKNTKKLNLPPHRDCQTSFDLYYPKLMKALFEFFPIPFFVNR